MVQNTDLQVKAYSENLAPILVPSLLLPSFPTGNFFKWFILFKKRTSHIHTHMLSPPSSCPHFSSFIKQDILETIPGLYGDGACFPPPMTAAVITKDTFVSCNASDLNSTFVRYQGSDPCFLLYLCCLYIFVYPCIFTLSESLHLATSFVYSGFALKVNLHCFLLLM